MNKRGDTKAEYLKRVPIEDQYSFQIQEAHDMIDLWTKRKTNLTNLKNSLPVKSR